mmetsp:Transcript_75711/g.210274  ORF Transcript_75711/g.210274 Transcript_75711/m.210274 type:complete len:83 (+) Transcript_75711:873-1121(+)
MPQQQRRQGGPMLHTRAAAHREQHGARGWGVRLQAGLRVPMSVAIGDPSTPSNCPPLLCHGKESHLQPPPFEAKTAPLESDH